MTPIQELAALARSLGEARFVARFPAPALLLNPDAAQGAPAGAEGWVVKTQQVHFSAADLALLARARGAGASPAPGPVDAGETPSPDVDQRARGATDQVAFAVPGPRSMFPTMVTLGRAPNCDVVLPFATISKLHAYLRRDPDGAWQIHDQRATNGTLVDGRRVEPGGSRRLEDGVTLHLGPSLALRFLLPPSLFGHLVGPRLTGRLGR